MASAEQTLQAWQILADRGEEDKLPADMKKAFDEARKRGMIKDNRGIIAKAVTPQREGYPEYPLAVKSPEEALQGEIGMGNKDASLSSDKYGNPIINTKKGAFYVNRPGLGLGDISRGIDTALDLSKEVAPYLTAGAVTAPARAAVGVLAQGGTGLVSEAINQTGNAIQGQEVDESRMWKTPLFAMAGDVAGRTALAIASPILTRLLGKRPAFPVTKPDGSLTDEAIAKLNESGVTPKDFDNLASFELAKLQREGVLTKEQAERYNFFKEQGLNPTTAQVTRSADDFQAQQELAKRNSTVRTRLEEQEGILSGKFDARAQGAGGAGSPISDAVLSKATALDNQIGQLYKDARAALPPDKNIQLGKFNDLLRSKGPSNQATNGLISSIRGYMKDAGLQGGATTTIGANALPVRVSTGTPVGVGQAEALRIELNRLYSNTNREGRAIIRQLKDAIDEDVLSVAGKDFFEQARAAKSSFEAGLRPETLSKFDTNESSLVRDILDNSIRGEDVFQNVVLSKSWKPSDIRELKSYLTSGNKAQLETGANAWSGLRADTIQWLKEQAFKGPMDAVGNQAMSRAGLESAIRRIGRPRLETILSPQEVGFIDDMLRVARMREPVRGTVLGKGPSAQAIESLEKKISQFPLVGSLWQSMKAAKQAEAMVNPAAKTVETITKPALDIPAAILPGISGLGAASGASLGSGR